MILNSPYISGSLTVTGATVLSGSVTLASGASISGTASLATTALTASSVSNLNQNVQVTGSLTVSSAITAQTLVVQTVTSSVVFSSGSNIFGNSSSNTQQFTGSMLVSGSGTFTGIVTAGSNVVIPSGYELVYGNGTVSMLGNSTNNSLDFRTSNTQRMFISSSGNVGIGTTTPNGLLSLKASLSDTPVFRLQNNITTGLDAAISTYVTSTQTYVMLGTNYYINSSGVGTRFNTSYEASAVVLDEGNLRFITGTSGASPSTRLTIANSGNLNIETNNVAVTQKNAAGTGTIGLLRVTSTDYIQIGDGGTVNPSIVSIPNSKLGIINNAPQARLHIGDALSSSSDITNGFILKQTSTNETTGIYIERSGERKGYAIYVGGSLDSLNFQRNNAGTKSDVMTLSRDANVGIRNTNPARALDVFSDGAQFGDGGSFTFYMNVGSGAATGCSWYVNGADRLRIYPNGSIVSLGGSISLRNAAATSTYGVFCQRAQWLGSGTDYSPTIAAEGGYGIYTYTNGSTSPSGPYVAPGGTTWTNGSSDIRKKKNFETTQGLAEVLQVEPIKYHFKEDDDNSKKRLGFKAQNILPLIPEMVSETGEMAEDGSPYLTITPDYMLPVLVKAIQEQQTLIESLKARIEVLESK